VTDLRDHQTDRKRCRAPRCRVMNIAALRAAIERLGPLLAVPFIIEPFNRTKIVCCEGAVAARGGEGRYS
jgi:hypothetical protein